MMRPIRVRVTKFDNDGTVDAVWVACDRGAAIVIIKAGVFYVPFESLEVLEDVTCDEKSSSVSEPSSGSKPAADSGSATRAAASNERKVGLVRKRRRKRASSLRGPRSNQWKPEEMA